MVHFQNLQTSQIEIITQMMQDFYAIDNYPINIEESKKLFEEFISNENLGKSYLIYNDSEIVGYIIMSYIFSFEYKGRMAFFEELFINKSSRRLGIGKFAIEFIKQEARVFFYRPVEMTALAEKFYAQSDVVYLWRKNPFWQELLLGFR